MTKYAPDINTTIAFKKPVLTNILTDVLATNNLNQLKIAETEKYAHITFFFNGGIDKPFKNETRTLIPSPKVTTYDQKPEMSAFEITEQLVSSILSNKFDFILCNYANADMVGHTGNLNATVQAIENLDECLAKVIDAIRAANGCCLITADHGNAEVMFDPKTNQPHTAHTSNLVPLIFVGEDKINFTNKNGTLADIAPTILKLLNIDKPKEMTGSVLY
jgi:2,3-bisphosphoglycerate-independent phosphoglycerate mutase